MITHLTYTLHSPTIRDTIPAHYGQKPMRAKRKVLERWGGVVRLSWQHLVMCILLLTSVYCWVVAQRCTGSRCADPVQSLDQFVYAGDFHRSRQLTGAPDSISTATRSLLLAQPHAGSAAGGARKADTLVVYVYSPTDPEYANNLRYFLRQGVHDNDGCDYVFVLQSAEDIPEFKLPALPRNSKYVRHTNECFDWGTVGWAIKEGHAQPHLYKYFIVMNSSVRGPYLPPYWPPEVHWTRVLTSRINEDVKLVGPTISCEGTDGTETHPARRNPHVQSYVVAMDKVGYEVLLRNQSVFQCYYDLRDTIFHSELGSTLAILGAGYTIDSLMLRYQGVDWRNKENWNCNGGINPYAEDHYDGVSLNPMEVLFVKVKGFMLDANWVSARLAAHYDDWANSMTGHNIETNSFSDDTRTYMLRHVWATKQLDPGCFDAAYYLAKNKDLPQWGDPMVAWHHYVMNGQFEGRPFRLLCKRLLEYDPTNPALPMIMDEATQQAIAAQIAAQQAALAEQQALAQQQAEEAARAQQQAEEAARARQTAPLEDDTRRMMLEQDAAGEGASEAGDHHDARHEAAALDKPVTTQEVHHDGVAPRASKDASHKSLGEPPEDQRPFGGAPALDWATVADALVNTSAEPQ